MTLLTHLGFDRDDGSPSLLRDLRNGQAGLWPRIGLSIASAALLVGVMLLCLGVVDRTTRLLDTHILLALSLVGMAWCGSLILLWWTYRRFARPLRTTFVVLCLWVVTIPICAWIGSVTRSELFISGTLFLASAATILIVAGAVYGGSRGRRVISASGSVHVKCSQCGYSLVGLSTTTCPECGHAPTIDQLIASQNYAMSANAAASPRPVGPSDPAPGAAHITAAPVEVPGGAGETSMAENATG